jgi:hypothetical protein
VVAEDIVRGYAGLAAVEEFAEGDSPGGDFQIGGLMDDTGTLAAQLQGHRSQVHRRLFQNDAAYILAAGKENTVEFFLQQMAVFGPSAVDHCHIFRGEHRFQQLRDDTGGGGGIGTGLYHGGIACGQGIHQGIQGQQQGIVPGAHNQAHPT